MTKDPRFSIVTTCKGRLEHLKESLPAMLAQADSETIVVDFSCPDETATYVQAKFPKTEVVRVEGEESFSNWRARNAGAKAAKGEFLVFCDADVVLAKDATKKLAKVIAPGKFGYFSNDKSREVGETALGGNQLKGFQVIPRAAFEQRGGYDELLGGYAAGGDTDLEERLRFQQLEPVALELDLIDRVIAHDDEARMRFHDRPAAPTFLIGHLYRWMKVALMGLRKGTELDPATNAKLRRLAQRAAMGFLREGKSASVRLSVHDEPLNMLKIARRKARLKISILFEIVDEDRPPSGK